MATHTSKPSSDSLQKPASDYKDIDNQADHEPIKSEHSHEEVEEESSLKKICDDDNKEKEGVKIDQTSITAATTSTTKKSSATEEAVSMKLEVPDISKGVGGSSSTEEESGRERLSRHRREMAGRVWIPDTWGQEGLLKDWIDCNAFDSSLINNNILSARAALMQQRSTTTAHVPNNPNLLIRGIENSDETSN